MIVEVLDCPNLSLGDGSQSEVLFGLEVFETCLADTSPGNGTIAERGSPKHLEQEQAGLRGNSLGSKSFHQIKVLDSTSDLLIKVGFPRQLPVKDESKESCSLRRVHQFIVKRDVSLARPNLLVEKNEVGFTSVQFDLPIRAESS